MTQKRYADTNLLKALQTNGTLTELEISFLEAFIDGLFAEPHFSDQDVKDVAEGMGAPIATAKGVLGSLVKKGYVNTQDSGTGYDLIYLNEEKFFLHTSWREDEFDGCFIPEELKSSPAPVSENEKAYRALTQKMAFAISEFAHDHECEARIEETGSVNEGPFLVHVKIEGFESNDLIRNVIRSFVAGLHKGFEIGSEK